MVFWILPRHSVFEGENKWIASFFDFLAPYPKGDLRYQLASAPLESNAIWGVPFPSDLTNRKLPSSLLTASCWRKKPFQWKTVKRNESFKFDLPSVPKSHRIASWIHSLSCVRGWSAPDLLCTHKSRGLFPLLLLQVLFGLRSSPGSRNRSWFFLMRRPLR